MHEPAGADTAASSRLRDAADRARRAPDIPVMEWVFAALGLALVASTIGFIAYKGYTGDGAPPQISFEVDTIVQLRDGHLVTIRALNRGESTAMDVTVEGELAGAQGAVETSEMSFKYLPPRSERKGGLFFTQDPRAFKLTLKPRGYEAP